MVPTIFGLALVIHFTNVTDTPRAVVAAAQAEVIGIFRDINIEIEFRDTGGRDYGGPAALQVTLVSLPSGPLLRNTRVVLGSATRTVYGTGTAWVYVTHVEREARRHDVPIARVLAGALAHEIAHLLQPVSRHADSGLMRAGWDYEDFRRVAIGALRLSPSDVPPRALR